MKYGGGEVRVDRGETFRFGLLPTLTKHLKQNLLFISFVQFTSGTSHMA